MNEPSDTTRPQSDEPTGSAGLDGVPSPFARALQRRGIAELTSVQRAVLDAESEGRDLRISSQTGSGKTVAIGLALAAHVEPASDAQRSRGPRILVLVPTRELAMQVRDELTWLYAELGAVRLQVLMGGTSLGLERRGLAAGPRIVVGTPGRVLDHLKAGALVPDGIDHVVLDESDRMLDMGFRDELEAILERLPEERRTHLVSATFPREVRRLADRFQQDALHIEGTRLGAANRDIEHVAHVVSPRDCYAAIVNLLLLAQGTRCLIFVERRIDVSELATKLSGDGFPVQSFSGDLPQAQRTRTLEAFRDGTIKTLVSTDVAARGIDVPDIELVIHVDPPGDADTYVHRSGRTGRAGRTGRSVMLVAPRARRHVSRLLSQAGIEATWQAAPGVAKVHKALRKRFRQGIHERLASDESPTQAAIDYAKGLLDGRDPAEVVATLMEIATPTLPRPPMEIREVTETEERRPRGPAPGAVRFTINWGERGGAAANRLLGHVCRRGQIRGSLVGAIDIGPYESTFDVDASVADRFEKLVRRPDERDPRLRIWRSRPSASGRRASPEQGGRTRRGPHPAKRGRRP